MRSREQKTIELIQTDIGRILRAMGRAGFVQCSNCLEYFSPDNQELIPVSDGLLCINCLGHDENAFDDRTIRNGEIIRWNHIFSRHWTAVATVDGKRTLAGGSLDYVKTLSNMKPKHWNPVCVLWNLADVAGLKLPGFDPRTFTMHESLLWHKPLLKQQLA